MLLAVAFLCSVSHRNKQRTRITPKYNADRAGRQLCLTDCVGSPTSAGVAEELRRNSASFIRSASHVIQVQLLGYRNFRVRGIRPCQGLIVAPPLSFILQNLDHARCIYLREGRQLQHNNACCVCSCNEVLP
jgi:hypothetical protein